MLRRQLRQQPLYVILRRLVLIYVNVEVRKL